jgi:hypothetical protein
MKKQIKLNDILHIEDLSNVKIQLVYPNKSVTGDSLEKVKKYMYDDENELKTHMDIWFGWNAGGNPPFKKGQIGILLLSLSDDRFLLITVREIKSDALKVEKEKYYYYEFDEVEKFSIYFDRLIIRCHSKNTRMICQNATTLIDELEVEEILPEGYRKCSHPFPGYDNVNISWHELSRVISKETWKTALQNQKGIYLISDTSNGKMYVGSASGENMLLGRWQSYVTTGHGGNKELKKLGFDYIKENFRYSILEIFKSTTDDNTIIKREIWWKEVLLSRNFGYNEN